MCFGPIYRGSWDFASFRSSTIRELGNKEIEDAAGFALALPRYDSYFTWSLLVALTLEGRVEALQPGKRNKRYRLAGGQ